MRLRSIATILLLVASVHSLAAQVPVPRSPCDFDLIVCEYSGVINVADGDADGMEVIAATVSRGVVHCMVRYTDANGTRSANGPGLITITLGIVPDADDIMPLGVTKQYTLSLACPNAMYDSPREAAWSHSFDTYKQPGGDVGRDSRGQTVLPAVLEGSTTESPRMVWRLCRGGQPPAPATIPPAPPPPC
jgi:hypothetical protein